MAQYEYCYFLITFDHVNCDVNCNEVMCLYETYIYIENQLNLGHTQNQNRGNVYR